MVKHVLIIFILTSVAVIAGWQIDVARLFNVFPPIVVCLSIMAAAVFVRLNRGMPTLDWKSLTGSDRKRITSAIEGLSLEYIGVLAINAFAILMLIVASGLGPKDAIALPSQLQSIFVAAFVGTVLLAVYRMAYVVWRDYDIIKLQRKLIDDAVDRETNDLEKKEAENRLAEMRSANLKAPALSPVQPWEN